MSAFKQHAHAAAPVAAQHPPDKLRTAIRLYEQRDMTVAQIGKVLGVSRSTIYRALKNEASIVQTPSDN